MLPTVSPNRAAQFHHPMRRRFVTFELHDLVRERFCFLFLSHRGVIGAALGTVLAADVAHAVGVLPITYEIRQNKDVGKFPIILVSLRSVFPCQEID